MLNRLAIVRFVVPVLAIGAIVFGSARVSGAEAEGRLVAASTARKAPVAVAAKRPVVKAAPAPAPVPAPETAPAARQPVSEDQAWGQVNAVNVNVRTGPNTRSAIVATLKSGEYVKARAIQGDWYEIQWPQSIPVWIGKEFVQVSAERGGTVSSPATRVYSAGTPQSQLVAKLEKGASVTIVGEEGNWYKIQAPEAATAYISARYVVAGVEAPSAAPSKITPAPVAQIAAPAVKSAAAASAPKPAPVVSPARTPEQTAAVTATLSATIEDTRRELKESDSAQAETARLTVEAKKAEAVEQARRDAEARRLADLAAIESRKKFEAEEQARRDTEARKKADAEEQARREADAKRLEQIESARLALEAKKRSEAEELARRETAARLAAETEAAETKKRVEAEEQARRDVEVRKKAEAEEQAKRDFEARKKAEADEQAKRETEARRLEQIESARIAAETKRKADAEAQILREAELKKKAEIEAQATKKPAAPISEPDGRGGLFVDPSVVPPAPAVKAPPKVEPVEIEPQTFSPLPAPSRSKARTEKAEPDSTSIAYKPLRVPSLDVADKAAQVDQDAALPVPLQPDADKRVRSKFVLPSREPSKPGNRAEIVELGSGKAVEDAAPSPATPLLKPASPILEIPQGELPEPTSAAPASIRLKPHFETQVGSVNAGGPVITSDGTIERATLSPVEGATYALVRDGRTIHYLSARAGLDLENYVGRRITVTGLAVQGSSTETPVLEISSVTARE